MNRQDENQLPFDLKEIFELKDEKDFNRLAIAIFHYQYSCNTIYRQYCDLIKTEPDAIDDYRQIPFLPISFFKTHRITAFSGTSETTFLSSGTTGMTQSKHEVKSLEIYTLAFMKGFEMRFGAIEDYVVFGLLPSYLEREGSSLVYMVDRFIKISNHKDSGFFLDNYEALSSAIRANRGKKILLIGVAYALLDFGENSPPDMKDVLIMETGGMKGKRKELIKTELHTLLKKRFQVDTIYSEYGMTELLSQAYSKGEKFKSPPWMKVLTRAYNDPFCLIENKTGGLNIIDLANVYSCSFIATQDLGRIYDDYFEVLGRFDNSDVRGCNLLVQ